MKFSKQTVDSFDYILLSSMPAHCYDGTLLLCQSQIYMLNSTKMLRASVAQWRQQGEKGVWIKLPIQHANLVEPALKEGFWYHRAELNYLMLCYWIPEGTHTLPANASHRVGIGAFVMSEKREVLVVQENTGRCQGTGVWKFPTGVVDEGEDICAAAVREVKEETAVSNSYSFMQWMPFEEYASQAQPFVQKYELLKYIVDICLAKKETIPDFLLCLPLRHSRMKRNYT